MRHVVWLAKIHKTGDVLIASIAQKSHELMLGVSRAIIRGSCSSGVECVGSMQ